MIDDKKCNFQGGPLKKESRLISGGKVHYQRLIYRYLCNARSIVVSLLDSLCRVRNLLYSKLVISGNGLNA